MSIRVTRKPAHAYRHGNLRPALIQAGLRLLSEGGAQNLSLRAAAQMAGVSHAAPYRHFADKDALVAAIAEEGFGLLATHLREAVTRCKSPLFNDRLREMAVGYVTFALDHPAYLRVIFGGVIKEKSVPDSLRLAGDAAYAVLRDLVEQGVTAGGLRTGDPDAMALACWSLVHGFAMLLTDRALPPSLSTAMAAQAMTRTLATLLLEGMNADADRPGGDPPPTPRS